MFGIGMPEMLLILAIALIVIGPKKLPDLAKSIGRAMGEFKKATNEIKESMEVDTGLKDVKETLTDINADIKDSISFDTIADYKPEKKPRAESSATNSSQKTASSPPDTDQAMGGLKQAFENLETDEKDPAPSAGASDAESGERDTEEK
jgi:TatA/E family protein of Tat protein translocase